MKAAFITLAALLIFGCASAQKIKEPEVPAQVKEAFSNKYPGVKAHWEKEDTRYEAEFHLNKIKSSATFDAGGIFQELEQEINASELPKNISSYCKENFRGYKLTEASKITEAFGKVIYEAEMSMGKKHFDAVFDESGNFLKKEGENN